MGPLSLYLVICNDVEMVACFVEEHILLDLIALINTDVSVLQGIVLILNDHLIEKKVSESNVNKGYVDFTFFRCPFAVPRNTTV